VKPRITLITLGVSDLERAMRFYRDGLGWRTEGIVGKEFEYGAVAFFDLTDVCLAHNVRTQQEVDAVMAQAKAAGASIVKPAQKTFWGGYAGYFSDPDQHLWEVAWNPQMLPPE